MARAAPRRISQGRGCRTWSCYLRSIALLWESQYQLENLDLSKALDLFARATETQTGGLPRVAMQRARLRLHQLDGVRTSVDYDTAIEQTCARKRLSICSSRAV